MVVNGNEGIRRFDLYDFFSILLPGTALIFGLYPFLPMGFSVDSIAALVPFLVGGFIVGRAVHSTAVSFQRLLGRLSHREAFERELAEPTHLATETVDEFYEYCRDVFDTVALPADRESAFEDGGGSEEVEALGPKGIRTEAVSFLRNSYEQEPVTFGETLYVLVRAYVHIDGTGRSRTFQAVHAFYRSTEVVSAILVVIYLGYAVKKLLSESVVDIPALLPYTTIVDHLGFEPEVIALGAILLAALSWKTFSTAKRTYRRYYLQYLVMDFLLLTDGVSGGRDDDNSAVERGG